MDQPKASKAKSHVDLLKGAVNLGVGNSASSRAAAAAKALVEGTCHRTTVGDFAEKYRQLTARRKVMSLARSELEKPDVDASAIFVGNTAPVAPKAKLHKATKAVAGAVHHVSLANRMTNALFSNSTEHQLRQKLVAATRASISRREWTTFGTDLEFFLTEMMELNMKHAGQVDLGDLQAEIEDTIELLAMQETASETLRSCLTGLENAEQLPSKAFEHLVSEAQKLTETVEQSASNLEAVILKLGLGQMEEGGAGRSSVTTTMSLQGAGVKTVGSQGFPRDTKAAAIEELLAAMPEEMIARFKKTLCSPEDESLVEECTRELVEFGASKEDAENACAELRRVGWQECVDNAMQDFAAGSYKKELEHVKSEVIAQRQAAVWRIPDFDPDALSLGLMDGYCADQEDTSKHTTGTAGTGAEAAFEGEQPACSVEQPPETAAESLGTGACDLPAASCTETQRDSEGHAVDDSTGRRAPGEREDGHDHDGLLAKVSFQKQGGRNATRKAQGLPPARRKIASAVAQGLLQDVKGLQHDEKAKAKAGSQLGEGGSKKAKAGRLSAQDLLGLGGVQLEAGSAKTPRQVTFEPPSPGRQPASPLKPGSPPSMLRQLGMKFGPQWVAKGHILQPPDTPREERVEDAASSGPAEPPEEVPEVVPSGLSTSPGSQGTPSDNLFVAAGEADKLLAAVGELRDAVVSGWGSASLAADALGGDSQGGITVESLHTALQKRGYLRSCGEVCAIFQGLGVQALLENSSLSRSDVCQLDRFAAAYRESSQAVANGPRNLLTVLQVRRVLSSTMSAADLVLARLHAALAGASGGESAGPGAIQEALEHCQESLGSSGAVPVAEALLSAQGLRLLVRAITSPTLSPGGRILATAILSRALVQHGGPAFGAVGDAAVVPSSARGGELLRGATSIGKPDSSRGGRGNSRGSARGASSFEMFLVAELWRPLFDAFDPSDEDAEPVPLDVPLLGRLLALLQQAHVPATLVGPEGFVLAPQITDALCRLHGGGAPMSMGTSGSGSKAPRKAAAATVLRRAELLKILEVMQALKESPGTVGNDVHTLATAFFGGRILRGQLARLAAESGDPPSTGSARGACPGGEVLDEWLGERPRLLLRWKAWHRVENAGGKFDALTRAVSKAAESGFPMEWPSAPPAEASDAKGHRPSWPHLSSDEGSAEGIEREMLFRLQRRWEKGQQRSLKLPRLQGEQSKSKMFTSAVASGCEVLPQLAMPLSARGSSGATGLRWAVADMPRSARVHRNKLLGAAVGGEISALALDPLAL